MTASEMLETVKKNLKLEDDSQDLVISDVILAVCDYCNLSQACIPEILEPVIRKKVKGIQDYEACLLYTSVNRDIAINESQAITDCQNSKGVISDETIVKNHPWVEDADVELKLLKKQEEAEKAEISGMFPRQGGNPAGDPQGGDEA